MQVPDRRAFAFHVVTGNSSQMFAAESEKAFSDWFTAFDLQSSLCQLAEEKVGQTSV